MQQVRICLMRAKRCVGSQLRKHTRLLDEKIANVLYANLSDVLVHVGEPLQIGLPQAWHLQGERGLFLAEHLGEESCVFAPLLDLIALQLPLELRQDELKQSRSDRVEFINNQAEFVGDELIGGADAMKTRSWGGLVRLTCYAVEGAVQYGTIVTASIWMVFLAFERVWQC